MATRRQFIKAGILGGAALGVAGAWYGWKHRGRVAADGFAGPREREMLTAIVPVMLAEALPAGPPGSSAAVAATVEAVSAAVAGLSASTQKEVAELFGLLTFPPTRVLVAGVVHPWADAPEGEISAFLRDWRFSRFALLESAYAALHDLICAAWYGNSASWPRIDYPGPPEVSR